MTRLYKYSTLLTLLFSSGLLFFIVGQIDNVNYRYILFDIYQFGTDQVFKLITYKLPSITIPDVISFAHVAPIVNLISGFLWASLFSIPLYFVNKTNQCVTNTQTNFWKKVFFTNAVLSVLFFAIWFFFIDIDFIYNGEYSTDPIMPSKFIYELFIIIPFIPSIVPALFSSLSLDNYPQTNWLADSFLLSKTMTSFGLTVWSIVGVYIYDRVQKRRNIKSQSLENASS